jgi:hypothetical protein
MKISEQPTNHILVKAGTDSDWDRCDFAVVTCGGEWAERMEKRMDAVRPFEEDGSFSSAVYYDGSADFYVSDGEAEELFPDGRDWAFVNLEEGEAERFKVPEARLNCYTLALDKNGVGWYRAYGKYGNDEFYTAELPFRRIVGLVLNANNQTGYGNGSYR